MESKKSNHIDMNKSDLENLSKNELIEMLLKLEAKQKKPEIIIVDDYKPVPTPRANKPIPAPKSKPGWIRNPNTGRLIKINGQTYKRIYPLKYIINKAIKDGQEIDYTNADIDNKYNNLIKNIDKDLTNTFPPRKYMTIQ